MSRLDEMLKRIDDKYDKSPGMFFYDVLKAVDMALLAQSDEISDAKKMLDVENINGELLDKFVEQRTGIKRNKEQRAIAEIVIEGTPGTIIEQGTLVGTENLNFFTLEKTTIDFDGKAKLKAKCEEAGNIGNVPSGSICFFPITIQGLFKVNNPRPAEGGYEKESDIALRERYYKKIRKPAVSGNPSHYIQWAKEVAGVGEVDVIPLHGGNGKVTVMITNADRRTPEQKLIDRVKEHIENERPIGANVTVTGFKEKKINIKVKLTKDASTNMQEVKKNIEESIKKFFYEIACSLNFISYARVGKIILESEGVLDYENLSINELCGNLLLEKEEIPILNEVLVFE